MNTSSFHTIWRKTLVLFAVSTLGLGAAYAQNDQSEKTPINKLKKVVRAAAVAEAAAVAAVSTVVEEEEADLTQLQVDPRLLLVLNRHALNRRVRNLNRKDHVPNLSRRDHVPNLSRRDHGRNLKNQSLNPANLEMNQEDPVTSPENPVMSLANPAITPVNQVMNRANLAINLENRETSPENLAIIPANPATSPENPATNLVNPEMSPENPAIIPVNLEMNPVNHKVAIHDLGIQLRENQLRFTLLVNSNRTHKDIQNQSSRENRSDRVIHVSLLSIHEIRTGML